MHVRAGLVALFSLTTFASASSYSRVGQAEVLTLDPTKNKEKPASSTDEPKKPTIWYGAPIAIGDAVGIGLYTAALLVIPENRDLGKPMATVGAGTFLVVGPFTHALRERFTHAAGSLGMRVLFPILGHIVGIIAKDPVVDAVGVYAGALTASALDIFLLAREDAPTRDARAPRGLQFRF